jgi:hypothetical protein
VPDERPSVKDMIEDLLPLLLYSLIRDNKTPEALSLLHQGVATLDWVNQFNNEETFLHVAVQMKNLDMIRALKQ